MADSTITFTVINDLAVFTAPLRNVDWPEHFVAFIPFLRGDTFTIQTQDEDIVLVFSSEAVQALAILDQNPMIVTRTTPAKLQVSAESNGNCCVSVTPKDRVDNSACTSVEPGKLEIRWPRPVDPIET